MQQGVYIWFPVSTKVSPTILFKMSETIQEWLRYKSWKKRLMNQPVVQEKYNTSIGAIL